MTDLPTPLTTAQRIEMRKRVGIWARDVLRRSGKERQQVLVPLGQSASWLSNRLHGGAVTFSSEDLRKFASVLKVEIPLEIEMAVAQIRTVSSPDKRHSDLRRLAKLPADRVAMAGTAAGEMSLLIEAAAQGRPNGERDQSWVLRRLGLVTGRVETLEEIGEEAGVTRERVRQVESKLLDRAAAIADGHALPLLTNVHLRVRESLGMPWDVVEQELRRFLGEVPLREAVRFLETIRPDTPAVGMDRAAIYGTGNMLRVVANTRADVRFTSQVSTAARKIVNFAGAAMVNDIRALLESQTKKPVAIRDLMRTLNGLPEIEWLNEQQRWCWFQSSELSALTRRAALILSIARSPVDIETLYAGLVRSGRRDFDSHASEVADPVPPCHVVQAILLRHPDFRRARASSFSYVGSLDLIGQMESSARHVLDLLNQLGGAAVRAELYALQNHPDHPVAQFSLSSYLYNLGWIERIGLSAWALRGREIDPERRREVIRLGEQLLDEGGNVIERHPVGPQWSVELKLTDAVRRRGQIFLPSSAVPRGAAGTYKLPDGHAVTLKQDVHGSRLTQVGNLIRSLLRSPDASALTFAFDSERGALSVSPK